MTTAIEKAMLEAQDDQVIDPAATILPDAVATSGQELSEQLEGKDTVSQRLAIENKDNTQEDEDIPGTIQNLMGKTPLYVQDYFQWRKSKTSNYYYLAPREDVLEQLIAEVPGMIKTAHDKIYPTGGKKATTEADNIASRIEAFTTLDQDDKAFNYDSEVTARHKWLRDRAITRALYACRTQRELNSWNARLVQRKQPQPDTFMTKRDRGAEQAMQAAIGYSVFTALETGLVAFDDATIARIVKNNMWQDARFRTNDILSPQDFVRDETAEQQSDEIQVNLF